MTEPAVYTIRHTFNGRVVLACAFKVGTPQEDIGRALYLAAADACSRGVFVTVSFDHDEITARPVATYSRDRILEAADIADVLASVAAHAWPNAILHR